MPLVPEHSDSIRLKNSGVASAITPGVSIQHGENDGGDSPQFDDRGAILRIEHGDGSVTVSLDGKPLVDAQDGQKPTSWFGNLAEKMSDSDLGRIADDLLRGIEEDQRSRNDWIEERAQGIRLLGLKIEIPNTQGSTEGAPLEGMSKVRHPLLQEAVLRFQANARGEMLPTDGPVKIRNDSNNEVVAQDVRANALEKDMNHYLTSTATEYYPDTDRMFLMLGFGGTAFKKVYFCPLRNRPVSETVDANDLIVNDSATDLANAKRVTHRILMRPSVVKRLQILGVYRDTDLSDPLPQQLDAAQEAAKNQQGVTPSSMRPEDRDREIYECYCELDLPGFEHKHKGKESGLEIPYRVTIDVSSRQILSIVRNYDEDDQELPTARETFVKYTFVPGLGFYDIGLLHILGNTTNAVTAAWRELLDAGMFANFPGFLMSDTGARQATNIFRIAPGSAALVKTGGLAINQAIMPLPYKGPDPALIQLTDNIVKTGQRVGGTAEMNVAEGRADVPVGTMLAMVEQATKVLNSVHKRMHSAQAQEFRLLLRCFRDHPESFWKKNRTPAYQWDQQQFLQALEDYDLTPQADPNTASYSQRVMKVMALKQLQQQNPSLYNPIAIDKAALQAIGWSSPDQFMAPPQAQSSPPPELLKMRAETKAKEIDAQAKLITAQARAKEADARSASLQADAHTTMQGLAGGGEVGPDPEVERMKAHADLTVAQAKAQAELINAHTRAHEADTKRAGIAIQDAQVREKQHQDARQHALDLAKEVMQAHAENARTEQQHERQHMIERQKMAHEQVKAEAAHAAGRADSIADVFLRAKEHIAEREDVMHEREMRAKEIEADRELQTRKLEAERELRARELEVERENAAAERKLKAKQAAAKPKGQTNGKK